jgi:hypothetical protein
MQGEGKMAGLIAGHLSASLIPDDHRAAAARVSLVHAFELAGRQLVILDRDRQAANGRIKRGPFRDGPGAQHLADLDAQVKVERGRIMQLDDKPGDSHQATVAITECWYEAAFG